ncbi:MAG: DUF1801 domain-containing protein [Crocinitomicaceae bacterium]|jgi:uncharacterized protein YdhG (YjbR/CyaY superfamily)|nr:DUF1801 domain-containing protein [Crocinitomicaceae bacterium]
MHPEVAAHIHSFPKETQEKLLALRSFLMNSVEGLEETKNYGIPTFKRNGKNFIHYAGYAKHIGFYPGAGPIKELSEELKGYTFAKGSIQFPLTKELPFDLIQKIINLKLNA